MNKRNIIFLLAVFIIFGQQAIASMSLIGSLNVCDQQIIATMQLSDEYNDSKGIDNHFDRIKLEMDRKFAQSLSMNRLRLFSREDESIEEHGEPDRIAWLQKLQHLFSLILLLGLSFSTIISSQRERSNSFPLSADHRLYSHQGMVTRQPITQIQEDSRIAQIPSVQRRPLICCGITISHDIGSLPMIFGTNIAGNLVAIAISCYAPTAAVSYAAGATVGMVGGCLEGFSTDNRYFSHATHVWHNNLFTGYVADQVTGTCGSQFQYPVANAAAVGSVGGYVCGLCLVTVGRQCCQQRSTQVGQGAVLPVQIIQEMQR